MTLADRSLHLDDLFARELEGLHQPWRAHRAPAPRLVVLNDGLAGELGLDPAWLRTDDGVDVLAGNTPPEGATPVAQAYAGHQFGQYSPRLGDGRALLLGELLDADGQRRDLHLKGSGRTPFARGGDGLAPLEPMLREYVISEAMHALGIPTTRSLAVVATGRSVVREQEHAGAVLVRVAASHLRVGTFQFAAATGDVELLRRLADHAIARHHRDAADAENPYLALLDGVVEVQASLLAQWMAVGFVHGVMNTDNMTISGETIDYGPCAFLDAHDLSTVFSSIDHGGRYAYGQQPRIAQWNLARLAEALLPLIDPDSDRAVSLALESVNRFATRYDEIATGVLRAKLGLVTPRDGDRELIDEFMALLATGHPDHTRFFRSLSAAVRGDAEPVRSQVLDLAAVDAWLERWRPRVQEQGDPERTAAAMDAVNPVYVPRNHRVEEALDAAGRGDLDPFERLLEVLADPFDERAGLASYAEPDPDASASYTTFCGT